MHCSIKGSSDSCVFNSMWKSSNVCSVWTRACAYCLVGALTRSLSLMLPSNKKYLFSIWHFGRRDTQRNSAVWEGLPDDFLRESITLSAAQLAALLGLQCLRSSQITMIWTVHKKYGMTVNVEKAKALLFIFPFLLSLMFLANFSLCCCIASCFWALILCLSEMIVWIYQTYYRIFLDYKAH